MPYMNSLTTVAGPTPPTPQQLAMQFKQLAMQAAQAIQRAAQKGQALLFPSGASTAQVQAGFTAMGKSAADALLAVAACAALEQSISNVLSPFSGSTLGFTAGNLPSGSVTAFGLTLTINPDGQTVQISGTAAVP